MLFLMKKVKHHNVLFLFLNKMPKTYELTLEQR